MAWPHRYPDITHLHFFLWKYVKNIAYQSLANDNDEVKNGITLAIRTVDFSMLHRTWLDISYRLGALRPTNGGPIEIAE